MYTLFLIPILIIGLYNLIWYYFEFFQIDEKIEDWYNYRDQKESIYHKHDRIPQRKIIQFLAKPLFYCNVCMSSVWGTVFYILLPGQFEIVSWISHLLFSVAFIHTYNHFVRS